MAASPGIPLQIPQQACRQNARGHICGLGSRGRQPYVIVSLWEPQVQASKTQPIATMVWPQGRYKTILPRVHVREVPLALQVRQDPQVPQMQLAGPWGQRLLQSRLGCQQDESAEPSTFQPSS